MATSRIWRRLQNQWTFFLPLLIIGPALVIWGWLVRGSPYMSDLLLQLGSAFVLLIPLFVVERGLTDRIRTVSAEVARLQLKFTGEVSPELQEQLNEEILGFRKFLEKKAKVSLPKALPKVRIAPEEGDYAHFDSNTDEIVAGPTALDDRDLIAHVYSHHILQSHGNYERLSNSFTAKAVEAGLADYLTAAFHNRPSIGTIIAARRRKKGEIRNLANDRKFSEIHLPKDDYDSRHPSSDIFHDAGEVWGGAFWELGGKVRRVRVAFWELGGKVGRVRVARLLLQAWERFDPAASTRASARSRDARFVRLAGLGSLPSALQRALGGWVHRLLAARHICDKARLCRGPVASTSPASPRPDVEFVRELLETSPPKVQESVKTVFDRRGLNV